MSLCSAIPNPVKGARPSNQERGTRQDVLGGRARSELEPRLSNPGKAKERWMLCCERREYDSRRRRVTREAKLVELWKQWSGGGIGGGWRKLAQMQIQPGVSK